MTQQEPRMEEIAFIQNELNPEEDSEDIAEHLGVDPEKIEEMKQEGEEYNVERPQKMALHEAAKENRSVDRIAEFAGVPFAAAFNFVQKHNYEAHMDQDTGTYGNRTFHMSNEEHGEVLHGFLKEWKNVRELSAHDQMARNVLNTRGVHTAGDNELDENRKRTRARKRDRNPFDQLFYQDHGDIDGSYVAEDEEPAMEEYIDALADELNTTEIAEVINTVYEDSVVSEQEVGDYLSESDSAVYTSPGNFRIRPEKTEEKQKAQGMRDVLRHYHENFDQIVQGVQEGNLR